MRRRRVLDDLSWIGFGSVLVALATLAFGGVDVEDLLGDRAARAETATPAVVATVKGATSPRRRAAPSEPPPRRRQPVVPANEVVVAAVRGDCWVSLRRESAAGEVLFEGLLTPGRQARVRGDRVFVRLGAAENVDVTVGGNPSPVPPGLVDVVLEASVPSRGDA